MIGIRTMVGERALLQVLEFVGAITDRCREQFPRDCPACDRRYGSFAQYILQTTPIGCPIDYDPSLEAPFGIVDLANCSCGTTVSVNWEGPPSSARTAFRQAIVRDAERADAHVAAVLIELRYAVQRAALAGETP